MKSYVSILIMCVLCGRTAAQPSGSVFNFLTLPTSTHAAALGGDNVSLADDDLGLSLHNPALLCNVTNRSLQLGYTNYMSDSYMGTAGMAFSAGERGTAAAALRYVDYGSFEGYTQENVATGSFKAQDMALSLVYNYLFADRLSGGVTLNTIYSSYESYNSVAAGVDLGLNYYNEESDLSVSVVVRNLGGQIKAFDDEYERIPLDVAAGISYRLQHAPFRLSLTLNRLQEWDKKKFYNADGDEDSFGQLLMKHCIIGADWMPSDNFYLSLGYNYRRSRELSGEKRNWEGLCAGAGLTIKRVKAGFSYSRLHLSSSSLMFNFTLCL